MCFRDRGDDCRDLWTNMTPSKSTRHNVPAHSGSHTHSYTGRSASINATKEPARSASSPRGQTIRAALASTPGVTAPAPISLSQMKRQDIEQGASYQLRMATLFNTRVFTM